MLLESKETFYANRKLFQAEADKIKIQMKMLFLKFFGIFDIDRNNIYDERVYYKEAI